MSFFNDPATAIFITTTNKECTDNDLLNLYVSSLYGCSIELPRFSLGNP
jgi:hypothetical protein